jgi:hypothetical protein
MSPGMNGTVEFLLLPPGCGVYLAFFGFGAFILAAVVRSGTMRRSHYSLTVFMCINFIKQKYGPLSFLRHGTAQRMKLLACRVNWVK